MDDNSIENKSVLKDALPPQSLDAEQATLGALLLDWDAVADTATRLTPDRFYSYQNRTIYEAILALYKENKRGDVLSIPNKLEEEGKLEAAGGRAYIASLTSLVPTSANISFYIDIILDRALRRDVIKTSSQLKAASFDMSRNANLVLEEAEQAIFTLADKSIKTEILTIKDVVFNTIELIANNKKAGNKITGIASGIAGVDKLTCGFQNSELTIIGARPSIGKTAFALNMVQHIAIEKKIPCGFFSLEMANGALGQRLLSQLTKISTYRIRTGYLTEAQFNSLKAAAGECYNSPLYIVDVPNMPLLDLRAMARRMRVNQKVQIIFIDYIGLIQTDRPDAPVYETQSLVSRSLKALARELEIPIVVMCQVARDAEGREPTLAQLRGSGSIEQDADIVMFLHRERKADNNELEDEKNSVVGQDAKCIIAKQRNGATGEVDMLFFPEYTMFCDKLKKEDEE